MIELRWLHKKIEAPTKELLKKSAVESHSVWGDRLYEIRVLQYRLLKGFGEIVDGKAQGEWTDWINVPEVQDES